MEDPRESEADHTRDVTTSHASAQIRRGLPRFADGTLGAPRFSPYRPAARNLFRASARHVSKQARSPGAVPLLAGRGLSIAGYWQLSFFESGRTRSRSRLADD
jgi:hypothetical protein